MTTTYDGVLNYLGRHADAFPPGSPLGYDETGRRYAVEAVVEQEDTTRVYLRFATVEDHRRWSAP